MQVIKKEVCGYHISLISIDDATHRKLVRGLAHHKRYGSTLAVDDITRLRTLVRSENRFIVEDNLGKYVETYSTLDDAEAAFENVKRDIEFRYDEYERFIEGLDYFYTYTASPLSLIMMAIVRMKLKPIIFTPWPNVIVFETIEQYEEFLTAAKIKR